MSSLGLSQIKRIVNSQSRLFTILQGKGAAVTNDESLAQLVEDVNQLEKPQTPSDEIQNDKYVPDPLWPDIEALYENDPRRAANGGAYTYCSYYILNGSEDSTKLYKYGTSSANATYLMAEAYATSDGQFYELDNTVTTSNPRIHTWDKSKDIIDNDGRKIRWIATYSNTKAGTSAYCPSFNFSILALYYNSGTSFSNLGTGGINGVGIYDTVEYCKFGDVVTYVGTPAFGLRTKYIQVYDVITLTSNTSSNARTCPVQEIIFKNQTKDASISLYCLNRLKRFDTPPSVTKLPSISSCDSLKYINLDNIVTYSNQSDMTTQLLVELDTVNMRDFYFPNKTCNIKAKHVIIDGYRSGVFGGTSLSNYNSYVESITLKNMPSVISTTSGMLRFLNNVDTINIPEGVTDFSWSNNVQVIHTDVLYKHLILPESMELATRGITAFPTSMETVTFPNNWNVSGMSFTQCYKYRKDSILDLADKLKDRTGTTAGTITFGALNLSKLSDDEKALFTNKNWTIS